MKNMGRAFVLAICFTTTLQAAEIKSSIALCSGIVGDLARLECFDKLSKSLKLNAPQSVAIPAKGVGKWNISITKNPVDDSKTAILKLEGTGSQSKWGKPTVLILRCKSSKPEVYITWNEYLGSESSAVLTRFGQSEATTEDWGLSSDNMATFYPGDPVGFIVNLTKANTLVVQTTPYSESPRTVEFDLKGIRNALKPLRAVCATTLSEENLDRKSKFLSMKEGTKIRIEFTNGGTESGVFSSYDAAIDAVYLRLVNESGKELATKSYKPSEILSVTAE